MAAHTAADFFSSMDADGTGTLTARQVQQGLTARRRTAKGRSPLPSQKDIEESLRLLKPSADGLVDQTCFCDFVSRLQRGEGGQSGKNLVHGLVHRGSHPVSHPGPAPPVSMSPHAPSSGAAPFSRPLRRTQKHGNTVAVEHMPTLDSSRPAVVHCHTNSPVYVHPTNDKHAKVGHGGSKRERDKVTAAAPSSEQRNRLPLPLPLPLPVSSAPLASSSHEGVPPKRRARTVPTRPNSRNLRERLMNKEEERIFARKKREQREVLSVEDAEEDEEVDPSMLDTPFMNLFHMEPEAEPEFMWHLPEDLQDEPEGFNEPSLSWDPCRPSLTRRSRLPPLMHHAPSVPLEPSSSSRFKRREPLHDNSHRKRKHGQYCSRSQSEEVDTSTRQLMEDEELARSLQDGVSPPRKHRRTERDGTSMDECLAVQLEAIERRRRRDGPPHDDLTRLHIMNSHHRSGSSRSFGFLPPSPLSFATGGSSFGSMMRNSFLGFFGRNQEEDGQSARSHMHHQANLLQLSMVDRDFDDGDYEMLLKLDEGINRGAEKQMVHALPVMHVKLGQVTSCCICLTDMDVDEEVKKLPCNHFFHVECIDQWLKVSKSCPIDKKRIDE